MHQVKDCLYVGDDSDCTARNEDYAVVHACKHPCHQDAVEYTGSLGSSHPHYLSYRKGEDLYLNMIDPDRPMFMPEMFEDFYAFPFLAGRRATACSSTAIRGNLVPPPSPCF